MRDDEDGEDDSQQFPLFSQTLIRNCKSVLAWWIVGWVKEGESLANEWNGKYLRGGYKWRGHWSRSPQLTQQCGEDEVSLSRAEKDYDDHGQHTDREFEIVGIVLMVLFHDLWFFLPQ